MQRKLWKDDVIAVDLPGRIHFGIAPKWNSVSFSFLFFELAIKINSAEIKKIFLTSFYYFFSEPWENLVGQSVSQVIKKNALA